MTYIQPLILFFSLLVVWGMVRQRSRPSVMAVGGITGLLVISWPPADWLFSRPLEMPYPVRGFRMPPDVEAIVVLAGAVEAPHAERPYALAGPDTYERCEYAAWIRRQRPALPLLACGGRPPGVQGPAASATMREVLIRAGVPPEVIWSEEQSRSTHENAVYGAQILRRMGVRKVALVVEAQSMTRAAASFRKEGIEVVPAPSSFRQFGPLREELIPSWRAVSRNETTLHEAVGWVWYYFRGWI